MDKKTCVKVFVLVLLIVMSLGPAYGAQQSKAKSVILTTMDVKEPYEVIDIVTYRSSSTGMDDLITAIKKQAQQLGADAVVGLSCFSYADFLYAYGTAVSFKK